MIRIFLKRKIVLLVCVTMTVVLIGLHLISGLVSQTELIRKRDVDKSSPTTSLDADVEQGMNNTEVVKTMQRIIQNMVLQNISSRLSEPWMPGVFTYLPHLASRPDWLTPKLKVSKGRTNVSIVIGIPSIRRPMGIYVFDTLTSLFNGMNETERNDTVIILSIAEPWNESYEAHVIDQLQIRFPREIAQGLLEIITPRPEFYPDLDNLKLTLGDNRNRVKWRSKQNLDYAFLILHAWSRGRYYLQLEDDIRAVPSFITSMKEAIAKNYWDWFSLEFSTLGFIGRLFRSEDALKIMEFLLMFYSSKPCDWLYDDYLQVKMCGHGEKWSKCIHKIQNIARSIKPSLFQHEGLRSSLGGTENKLKDNAFEVSPSSVISNPPVENIITTLQTYSKYDIFSAYNGHDFFWGANPKEGDLIDFLFEAPVPLAKIYIETGNKEHPSDILLNSTLEILPCNMPLESSTLYKKRTSNKEQTSQQKLAYEERLSSNPSLEKLSTNDTFFNVGEFSDAGIASLDIPEDVGEIWVLRIHIRAPLKTWVLIKKIVLQVR